MLALYFDPAQPRDAHGRWSTLSGAAHVQRASDEGRDLAARHDALQGSAPSAERSLHSATYHAASAQHLINQQALGRPVEPTALDDHLSSLSRIVSGLRAAAQRGSARGAATDHYAGILTGLRAARRAQTGVHVAHHFGEPLAGAVTAPPAHLQGVLRPQQPGAPEAALHAQYQAVRDIERQTVHPLRRENIRHVLTSLEAYAQSRRAVIAGHVERAAQLFHEAAAHATRFDPTQLRASRDVQLLRGALDQSRDTTAHALHDYQPDPVADAAVAQMKASVAALRQPEPSMVVHGFQREPYAGGPFFDGHDHEFAGLTTPDTARMMAHVTGCATFAEFRRRMLGDHPLIDHTTTTVYAELRPSSSGGTPSLMFHADLRDKDGNAVGEMTRIAHRDKGLVENDFLALESHVQGGGIGPRLYQSQEEAWKAAGYTHVKSAANIDGGGYAWATHGFDYDPDAINGLKAEGHRRLVRGQLDALLQGQRIDQPTHTKYVRMLAECRHPWDFAHFCVDEPGLDSKERLVGKAALSGLGKTWYAVKHLDDTSPGNRVSNATRRTKGLKEKQ